MKLSTCLEIGADCGLSTWEECYDNIDIHSMMLFKYDNIEKELLELQKDMFKADPEKFCSIFNATIEELKAKGW